MGSAPPLEVTLRLLCADQLFAPPPLERLHQAHTLESGIDELFAQLGHRPLNRGVRATIYLPRSEVEADTEARLREAITRYCLLRGRRNETQLRTLRHEGVRALILGGPLAAVALALSALVFGDPVRDPAQVVIGEGLLLVIAWVALWYPIDMLLIAVRPYLREREILAAVRDMAVVVVPAD